MLKISKDVINRRLLRGVTVRRGGDGDFDVQWTPAEGEKLWGTMDDHYDLDGVSWGTAFIRIVQWDSTHAIVEDCGALLSMMDQDEIETIDTFSEAVRQADWNGRVEIWHEDAFLVRVPVDELNMIVSDKEANEMSHRAYDEYADAHRNA